MEKQAINRLKYLVGVRKENPIRDILIYCRRTHDEATYTQIAGEFQLTPARVREIALRGARRFQILRFFERAHASLTRGIDNAA